MVWSWENLSPSGWAKEVPGYMQTFDKANDIYGNISKYSLENILESLSSQVSQQLMVNTVVSKIIRYSLNSTTYPSKPNNTYNKGLLFRV